MLAPIATLEQPKKALAFVPTQEGLTYIEQLTVISRKQCPKDDVPFFYQSDDKEKVVLFQKGTCKMWACESCGARNAKRWIARIIKGCNTHADDWYFCTMTADENWRGKNSSLKNLRRNWPKLRKRLARLAKKHGVELFYVRVWEAHKDGSFHMHLVTNFPVTTKWLKDNAKTCGMGYQARSEKAKNPGQVAGYISKYMVKSLPNATEYPKGARRIEVSANWVRWKEKESDWEVCLSLGEAAMKRDGFKSKGYRVIDLALRNAEKEREKKFNEYGHGKVEDASGVDGHISTGGTGQSKNQSKTCPQGACSGQCPKCRREQYIKSGVAGTATHTSKTTNATERILRNAKQTRDSFRKRPVRSGRTIAPT